MSKKCPYCGADLEEDDLFCGECGKKQDDAAAGDIPGGKAAPKADTGPAGNAVPKADVNPVGNTDGQKKKKIIAAVIAVVVVIFLLSMCGRSSSPDDEEPVTPAAATEGSEEPEEPDDSASSSEAEMELIGYVEQAEALYVEWTEGRSEWKGDEESEFLEAELPRLEELQKQAAAVSGVDKVLADAAADCFAQLTADLEGIRTFHNFDVKFSDLMSVIVVKPKAVEEIDIEYYNAYKEWYESVQKAYEAIDTCPANIQTEWTRYGEILNINERIVNKLNWAGHHNDNLRWQSALNMSERFDIEEERCRSIYMQCLLTSNWHANAQGEMFSELAKEIHAYAELNSEERNGYEFKNVHTGEILMWGDDFESASMDSHIITEGVTFFKVVDTIYPSLYQTYDAFVTINAGCVTGTKDIVVEAEIPGFTQNYKESFTLGAYHREIRIKPPALTGELNLESAKDAQIRVSVTEKDGTLIVEKSFPVTIKSKYDFDWISEDYGLVTQDNILCFLTPESSAIVELKRQAIDEISSITDGQMESFVGYQNNAWNNHYVGTYVQAAGIMQALHDLGVRYNKTSFSISNSNQRILLPEDVLKQQSGLCIETSLVVASALQSAGMHAFLVLPPGHAQVAVEVWNGSGDDTKGTGQYFLIETTNLGDNLETYKGRIEPFLDNKAPSGGVISYKTAEDWKEYLSVEGTYLIDCDDSRVLGLTPFVN